MGSHGINKSVQDSNGGAERGSSDGFHMGGILPDHFTTHEGGGQGDQLCIHRNGRKKAMIRDIITALLVVSVIGLSWIILTDEKMTPGFKEKIDRLKRHVEQIRDAAAIKKPLNENIAPEKNRHVNNLNEEAGKAIKNSETVKMDKNNPETAPSFETITPQDKQIKQNKVDKPDNAAEIYSTILKEPSPERFEQNKELKLSTKELQEILGLLKEARNSLRDSTLKYPKRSDTLPDTRQDQSSVKKKSFDGPEGSELSRP